MKRCEINAFALQLLTYDWFWAVPLLADSWPLRERLLPTSHWKAIVDTFTTNALPCNMNTQNHHYYHAKEEPLTFSLVSQLATRLITEERQLTLLCPSPLFIPPRLRTRKNTHVIRSHTCKRRIKWTTSTTHFSFLSFSNDGTSNENMTFLL